MARRYDLIAQHGSNWRSPLWIPVVNGRRTVLSDYTLRARVAEFAGARNSYFSWATSAPGIEIVTVKLKRKDGSTFDTSGFHLDLAPADWANKRRNFEGDLEVELESIENPDFRYKIISGRRFRVTTDAVSWSGYDPEVISRQDGELAVVEFEYGDGLDDAEVISVTRDQLEGPVTRIGDLENVEESSFPNEVTVLVRDPDTGVYRSAPLSQITTAQRGSVVTYVDELPNYFPSGTQAGDWYVVISGDSAGLIYEVREV